MKKLIILSFSLCIIINCNAQSDSTWVRAFPITDYIVQLNDSTKLVQVHLPAGPILKDKQVGLLKGVYQNSHADTVTIGSGRCNLVKGDYYYFSLHLLKDGVLPKGKDLLYTLVAKPKTFNGKFLKLASHFIELTNVYEVAFYDRYDIFKDWTSLKESVCMDSIRKDIQFTGDYFQSNNPSMNVVVASGKFKGKLVLNVMTQCTLDDIFEFLDYMVARPRLYAGKTWKISEIFATWVNSGAPTVKKN